jgi:hypothetical protein
VLGYAVCSRCVQARLPLGCTLRVTGLEAMPESCCVLFAKEEFKTGLRLCCSLTTTTAWRGRSLGGAWIKSDTLTVHYCQEHVSNNFNHTQQHTGEATMHHQWESIVHSLLK